MCQMYSHNNTRDTAFARAHDIWFLYGCEFQREFEEIQSH